MSNYLWKQRLWFITKSTGYVDPCTEQSAHNVQLKPIIIIREGLINLWCRSTIQLTVPWTQGKRTPIVKIPNSGPCATAPSDMESCKTAPSCSTTKTNATQIAPKTATTPRMMYLVCVTVSGRLARGLKKSSSITADIEFNPVESEESAAENTPATNRPGKPGKSPRMSITKSGKSWSAALTSLVVSGSQSWYVA